MTNPEAAQLDGPGADARVDPGPMLSVTERLLAVARGAVANPTYRYGLAIIIPIIAVVARYALIPLLGGGPPFILIYVAVLLVAWWAGLGPALLAVAVSVAGSVLLVLEPSFDPATVTVSDVLNVLLAGFVLLSIAVVTARLRDTRMALEEQLRRERELAAEKDRLLAVRDAFASMLAHEVRTPITTILGQSRRIVRRAPELDAATADAVTDIDAEAERLYHLAENLLVLNRGEGQIELEPEPVRVPQVIDKLVAEYRRREPECRYEVEIDSGLPLASGEPTYVEQILRNLLSNAVKYGSDGQAIEVSARSVDGRVRLAVKSHGELVPEGDLERIFELFYREPATATAHEGAGVGLYVSSSLARAMGGRVWAERDEDGMTFLVDLPRFDEEA